MTKTLTTMLLILLASLAAAEDAATALKPPKGAQVALVVFEDLQCPDCRRAAPLVEQAAKTYKIPVVRHDFPLPMHNWSYDAALIAAGPRGAGKRRDDRPIDGDPQLVEQHRFGGKLGAVRS